MTILYHGPAFDAPVRTLEQVRADLAAMKNSPYLDRPLRTEAQARIDKFRAVIADSGNARKDDIRREYGKLWDRADALLAVLDWLDPDNPPIEKVNKLAADMDELARDLCAFAKAID